MRRASFLLLSGLLWACSESDDRALFGGASGQAGTSHDGDPSGGRASSGGEQRGGTAGKGGVAGKGGSAGKGSAPGKGGTNGDGGAAGEGGGGGAGETTAGSGGAGLAGSAGQAAGGSVSGAAGSVSGAAGSGSGAGGAMPAGGAAGTAAGGAGAGAGAGAGTGAGMGGSPAGAAGKGGSVVSPPKETSFSQCEDGKDNDADGLVDCQDDDCKGVPSCDEGTNEACLDGRDNDADGHVDCDDADCANNPKVTVCGKSDGTCSDGWEPNNNPGQFGSVEILEGDAGFCFEQTICQKDTDWMDFTFSGIEYGGKVSLTITLLSAPNGSTVVARATDLANKQAPIEVPLTAQDVTKSLAKAVAIDCDGGFCIDDEKRRVKVSTSASTPITYRLCAEIK